MKSKPWELKFSKFIDRPRVLGKTYFDKKEILLRKPTEEEIQEVIDSAPFIPESIIRAEYDPGLTLAHEIGHVKTPEVYVDLLKEPEIPSEGEKGYRNRLKNKLESLDKVRGINDFRLEEERIISEAEAMIWAYNKHKNITRFKAEMNKLKEIAYLAGITADRLASLLYIAADAVDKVISP